eukprot:g30649.t1
MSVKDDVGEIKDEKEEDEEKIDTKAETSPDKAPKEGDCIPLIEAATKQKEQGNAAVQRKAFGEAITAYGQAIQILALWQSKSERSLSVGLRSPAAAGCCLPPEDKADGHPVLRSEGEQMVVLKATLYSNTSQRKAQMSAGLVC